MNVLPIKENGFEGAPGGAGGTVNYGQQYGTFASPDVSQNPSQFDGNKALGSVGNTSKDGVPPSGSIEQGINAIYSKKDAPTPDDVIMGINYELSRMIKRDKNLAKQNVVANLKKDPKYYKDLNMLNVDDEAMVKNMTENKHPNDRPASIKVVANPVETRNIFSELAKSRDNKYVVNSKIVDIMKEMRETKKSRRSWQKGDPTL